MSDRDAREELRDITRQLRRWMGREQWNGGADLVVSTVAGVAPEMVKAAPRRPATATRGPAYSRPVAGSPLAIAKIVEPDPVTRQVPEHAAASAEILEPDSVTRHVPEHLAAGAELVGAGVVAEPVMLPDDWEPVVAGARSASRPESSAPGRITAPAPAAVAVATPADVNLFGDRVAPRAPAGVEVVDDPIGPLPPVHPPLAPTGASRIEILNASLPVLDEVATATRGCEKCGLCKTRTKAVPGVGSAASGIVFVGEAPGADEDAQGEPFVGRAGQLLTSMIQAMDDKQLIPGVKLDRSTVYICNVLKCRPPENRNPLPHEIEQCSPYLVRQLEALQPRIICCLGKFAAELLTGVKSSSLGAMREKTYRYRSAKLIVTYHPAALLRNPNWKRPAWDDLQRLAREYLAD